MKTYDLMLSNDWLRSYESARVSIESTTGTSKSFYKRNINPSMLKDDIEFVHNIAKHSSGNITITSQDLHRFSILCDTQKMMVPFSAGYQCFLLILRCTADSRRNSIYTNGKSHKEYYNIKPQHARRFMDLLSKEKRMVYQSGHTIAAVDPNGVVYVLFNTKDQHIGIYQIVEYKLDESLYDYEAVLMGDDTECASKVIKYGYKSRRFLNNYEEVTSNWFNSGRGIYENYK